MVAFSSLLCHYLVVLSRGDFVKMKNRMEDLRIDADKTQLEIAKILHCQREVYRRYEKGKRELPVWAAIKLAEYYNVSVDYLLGISNQKRRFGQ